MHDEILERLALGLARDADAAPDPELAAHLATCEGCRFEWAAMRMAHAALTEWGRTPPPAAVRPAPPVPLSRWTRLKPLMAAALAGLVVGVGGTLAGGQWGADEPLNNPPVAMADTRPLFALLLEEPVAAWPPSGESMRPAYIGWRDSLLAAGTFAGGQRFAVDAGWYVGTDRVARPMEEVTSSQRGPTNYSGLFLVHADSYEDAVRIAQQSPHLAYGGILVRASPPGPGPGTPPR